MAEQGPKGRQRVKNYLEEQKIGVCERSSTSSNDLTYKRSNSMMKWGIYNCKQIFFGLKVYGKHCFFY